MNPNTFIIVALLLLQSASCQNSHEEALSESRTNPSVFGVIAFGSCSRQYAPQPLWDDVMNAQPDLWIWLGDNIYGDTENMAILKAKYDKAKHHPGYQQLRKIVPVIGTWDDHDYGVNDGGKEYPKKDSSKMLLLEFLDVPANAPVWDRPGVYQSYTFGKAGQRVKVILLDTRYFRDTLTVSTKPGIRYDPNETGDILGERQWQWLENELSANDAEVTIIGSSIQVLHEQQNWEKWVNFPKSRQRLFDLIRKYKPGNLVLISGDRHMAEVARMELEGYPQGLYELTSSGMTHAWQKDYGEANKYRIGGHYVMKRNFGLIRIDWSAPTPAITLMILGDDGAIYRTVAMQ